MITTSEDRKFVDTLKLGDKVFVCNVGNYSRENNLSLKEVKRVTKSHIIIEIRGNEQKFRKDNLEKAGRKFGRMHIGDSHEEIVEYNSFYIAKYERQQKENKCKRIIRFLHEQKLSEWPDEALNKCYEILVQFELKTKPQTSSSLDEALNMGDGVYRL